MATKTETHYGTCPTHGHVTATREVPSAGFPFVLYAIRRYQARRQAFLCPTCGAAVEPD
jgi:predicted RNA-binding Zn-ribbon protein involved in translation (DUF1610 family)